MRFLSFPRILIAKLRTLVRRDVVAGEIRDELQFHLQMRAEEYERRGATHDEARRQASRRVGNLALLQDRGYDVRGGGVMETILQDIKYSLRLLRKQPQFSLVAILTLALGIGASTALFSVIDSALLRPLPYPHPEQLVEVSVRVTEPGGRQMTLGPAITDARDWRSTDRVFAQIGVWTSARPVLVDTGEPERLNVTEISEGILGVYGVTPILGRGIELEDTRAGAPPVVLLGYNYWQSRFGGATDVIGRLIRIADEPTRVVGVLPASFYRQTPIWRPLSPSLNEMGKRGSGTGTDGRLRPGISLDQAALELTALTTRLARERGEPADVHVQVRSLLEGTTANYRETLNILAAAVGLILLIACVNVAGLLLARGATRSSELAVRAAIGAGRARLIRQLLTESLVLSVLGGLAGVLLAWLSLDALVAIIPMSLPSNSPATMNLPVLAFTAGLSLLTSVIFGLVPAFRLSRVHVGAQLGRASIRHGSALSRRGGQLLIAAEVALAVVLLAGAGLMVRSFARIVSVNVGFDPRAIVTLQATPLDLRPGAFEAYYAALVNTIRAMPGVVAVGAVDQLPLGGISTGTRARVEGGAWVGVGIRQILPGYFEAMGLSLQQGRLPVDADRTTGGPSVVMNEDAAKLLFGDGAPVGRRVEVDKQSRVVIGVIGSVRHMGPRIPASAEVYMLFGQTDAKPLTIVVRPSNAGLSLDAQLRHAAVAIEPRVFLEGVRPGTDWFEDRVLTDRHRTWLFGLLGGLGLLLTLVGIFGTTAYAVARRTPEIGVRMAFGARPTQVVQMMVRDAAWPVGIGTIVGLGGATLGTRVIQTFLFNTAPTDHVTFAAVALTLGFTACVAAWIPARRAARVDPLTALRSE